jgi:SAM-dependent methyltransferase
VTFYSDISAVYDDLFPVSPEQKAFLDSLMTGGTLRSVTDCGCGTGAQLLPFAAAGLACLGFDPSPSLIAIARRKLATYPRTRAEVGVFADLLRLTSFPSDLLMCLGNSLVHVPQEEAARFLSDAGKALNPGGTLLLQILNYERLRKAGITDLPLIRAVEETVEFRRHYEWESNGKVRFQTNLRLPTAEGPRILRNELPLYPVYPDELWEMLLKAGFADIRFHGSFARTDFSPESEALVCLARKW